MVPKPIAVNGRLFKTKCEARKFVGAIRAKYLDRPGVPFDDEDAMAIIEWTIKTHELAEEKVGCGVDYVVILDDKTNYRHGVNGNDGRVMHFVRSDGSSVPVSLDGNRSHKQDTDCAFRREVSRVHRGPCAQCGAYVGPFNGHHAGVSFRQLLDEFMQAEQLTYERVLVSRYGVARKLSDRNLADAWKRYHDERAVVVSICKLCHDRETYGRC